MKRVSIAIVGAGVVGRAIARALSARWTDVFVLEAFPKWRGTARLRRFEVQFEGMVTETSFESALWMLLESTAVT